MDKEEGEIKKKVSRRGFLKLGVLGFAGFTGCRTGSPPHPTGVTSYKGPRGAYALRGMVYTCRTGHVDIAHAKKFARKTNLHASTTSDVLKNEKTVIDFHENTPLEFKAYIDAYPSNWKNIDAARKEEIIEEISIKLGQYFAHCNSIGYETSGWFGYKKQPWVSEFPSAFSWEDRYSDEFGIYAAGFAIKPEDNFRHSSFNSRLSRVLDDLFSKFDIQQASVSKKAAVSVSGDWYLPGFWGGESKMRNFDFGNDDGFISPCIPKVSECGNVAPFLVPVPNLSVLDKYRFKMRIEIRGNCKGVDGMRKIVGKEVIDPVTDFPKIRRYLEQDALRKGDRYGGR